MMTSTLYFTFILFPPLCNCGPFFLPRSRCSQPHSYELVINSAVPGVDLMTSSVMAQTFWLNHLYSHSYTSFRHQADTHNRSPSPRSPTLHHSRCAPPRIVPVDAAAACRAYPSRDVPSKGIRSLFLERTITARSSSGGSKPLLSPKS